MQQQLGEQIFREGIIGLTGSQLTVWAHGSPTPTKLELTASQISVMRNYVGQEPLAVSSSQPASQPSTAAVNTVSRRKPARKATGSARRGRPAKANQQFQTATA
jgi:hypothetical protein